MQQLILKKDIEQSKMNALLQFLKSVDIDAELKTTNTTAAKKKSEFTLAEGIWKDHTITADDLRKKAWNRHK